MKFETTNDLKVDKTLFDFINNEVLPGTDINQDNFWKKFSIVVHEISPINKKLIAKKRGINLSLI